MATHAYADRSSRGSQQAKRKHKPKYRRQPRPGGRDRAFVELNGRRYYLGKYGSPDSTREYRRLLVEWEARGRRLDAEPSDMTIIELIDRFFDHVESYYRKPSGQPTSEVENFRVALRAIKEHYGETEAAEFSPARLKTVRAGMVERDWARTTVNKAIWRIKSMFRWAVENELLDESVYGRLSVVRPLQAGRGGDCTKPAREPVPVEPVDDANVEAIKTYVAPQVWALIQLQRLSGARGGELFRLRPKVSAR